MESGQIHNSSSVSVIIPTFREKSRIGGLLEGLRSQFPSWQLVVVDGGSDDGTLEVAQNTGADLTLQTSASRGKQMRLGAEAATGDIFLFLHADCVLPPEALTYLENIAQEQGKVWGAFKLKHQVPKDVSFLHKLMIRTADWRSQGSRIPYGDQGIFCTREIYEACGGMPKQSLMEDIEFAMRLKKYGPMLRLPLSIQTTARRYLSRPIWTSICWHTFPLLYRLGVSPERLSTWYGIAR
ncbi:MAG: TIGR04283 family arsenosugar biosynthesis glycosyltransferase [Planctomycetota bacterium]|jgi:rSAM/selenodomain-associated transferase 2|nr:TIGR04283 family arsenosugar biosynthesis glycosyltransferase [Planctomycetota bacterium]